MKSALVCSYKHLPGWCLHNAKWGNIYACLRKSFLNVEGSRNVGLRSKYAVPWPWPSANLAEKLIITAFSVYENKQRLLLAWDFHKVSLQFSFLDAFNLTSLCWAREREARLFLWENVKMSSNIVFYFETGMHKHFISLLARRNVSLTLFVRRPRANWSVKGCTSVNNS